MASEYFLEPEINLVTENTENILSEGKRRRGAGKGGQDHRESPGRKGSTREGVGWKGRSGSLKEGRGWMKRTVQVDGAGPEQWVESTGMGWGQTKRGGAWAKEWGQQWRYGKGEEPQRGWGWWEWRVRGNGKVSPPPESPLTPCLSLYPSLRDGAHSHPLPHGQSLPSVHGLRHQ